MSDNTVQFSGIKGGKPWARSFDLAPPASIGLRYELKYKGKSEAKVGAAALGLCSQELRGKVPLDHDLLVFGGKVLDRLLEQGFNYLQILAAGWIAYQVICNSLPPDEEVAATEAFFDPDGQVTSTP